MTEKFDKWNNLKQNIQNKNTIVPFRQGQVYFMSVGQNIGNEAYGKKDMFLRPVLVYRKLSKTSFVGIPLTSKPKEGNYYFTFRYGKISSTAMLNQIRVFDIKRALYYKGYIRIKDYTKLRDKVKEFVDITPNPKGKGSGHVLKELPKSKRIVSDINTFVNKNNKNILTTGCAGFIGSNFVPYFLDKYQNYNIINLDLLTYAGSLDNLKECENHPRYKFIKGDICNRDLVEYIFKEFDIGGVIHFAAESHVDNSIKNPDIFIKTNINGTWTLLDVAYKYWMDKPNIYKKNYQDCRFHHISTDEVYGTLNTTDLFTENTPYAPNSPYSASKASSDMIVRSYKETYGLDTIITNCSNNYGKKQHSEKLIPTIIKNALQGNLIPIYGDGLNIRDWLYVLDHCKGIDIAYHKGKSGETYNIGGENERTNLQIVNTICEILDTKVPQEKSYKELITFVTDRAGHDKRYAIDASKIENNLKWKADEDFESGIVKTIDWYLKKYNDK